MSNVAHGVRRLRWARAWTPIASLLALLAIVFLRHDKRLQLVVLTVWLLSFMILLRIASKCPRCGEGGVVKNLWLRRWPAECSCGLALAPERASPSISDLVLWLVAASGLVLVMWLD